MSTRSLSEHERDLLARARRAADERSAERFASWLRGFCQPAQRGHVPQSDALRRELIGLKREHCGPRT